MEDGSFKNLKIIFNLSSCAAQEYGAMTKSISSTCPKCATPIPEGAPQGLCPTCVLRGVATEIQSTASSSKGTKPPTVAEVGAHFPDLEVLEQIGAGGMGAVYKARQPKLDRFVALKILSRDLAEDPAFAERFDREARVLARLSHPNIVTVFDSGIAGPFAFLMMEFVDGVNLRQAMQAGRFTPMESLTLVQNICSALQFAHEKGILHRDIKPENILLDSRGQVKIADFGIAKLTGEDGKELMTLTQRGFVLGSPHYMAPEQIESPEDVDQRADIYSLGVVLYEMLTGELPIGRFSLPSEKAVMDARIDAIVLRTLEKERDRRYQSVSELNTGFERIGSPVPPSQEAFITEQIAGLSKVTFRIALILAAPLAFHVILIPFEDTDDLLIASDQLPLLAGVAVFMSTVSGILRSIHKTRTQGDSRSQEGPLSASDPVQLNSRAVRFATAACVCTALSFPLGLLFKYTMFLAFDDSPLSPHEGTPSSITQFLIPLLALTLFAVTGVLGFGLGVSALLGMRKSTGHKRGFYRALFGVLAWALVLVFKLTGLLLYVLFGLVGATHEGLFALIWIPVSLAVSTLLIRRVQGWVKGDAATLGSGETGAKPSSPAELAGGAKDVSGVDTAKFSSAAALWTGISLVLGAVAAAYINMVVEMSKTRPIIPGSLQLIVVFGFLIVGVPAFLGTGFGVSALREIRASAGRMHGLLRAIFGALAWPILVLGVLAFLSLHSYLSVGSGRSMPSSIFYLVVGVPLLLADMVMIRGIHGWVLGARQADGRKNFSGLAGTLLATLVLATAGPVLAALIFGLVVGRDIEPESVAEVEKVRSQALQSAELAAGSNATEDVRWRLGKPELAWSMTVQSGMKARLKLVLKDEDGGTRDFILGECSSQINGAPGHGSLKLGTVLVSTTHAMTASYQSGASSKIIRSLEDLRGFHFVDSPDQRLFLNAVGNQTFPLATLFADGQERATRLLSLEVVVTLLGDDEK